MATTGIINGTDLLVYSDGTAIAHSQSCTLTKTLDVMDTSTKASLGWKTIKPGQRAWNIDVSGLVALDNNYNYAYLLNLIIDQTRVFVQFRQITPAVGDTYFSGYAYLSNVSVEAPKEGVTTFAASFTGDEVLSLHTQT